MGAAPGRLAAGRAGVLRAVRAADAGRLHRQGARLRYDASAVRWTTPSRAARAWRAAVDELVARAGAGGPGAGGAGAEPAGRRGRRAGAGSAGPHWEQRLERARYEAERAARQYHAVEPENRLVARELERRWEQALRGGARPGGGIRPLPERPADRMTAEDRERYLPSGDITALWRAATTTARDRKEIIRLLADASWSTSAATASARGGDQVACERHDAARDRPDRLALRIAGRLRSDDGSGMKVAGGKA